MKRVTGSQALVAERQRSRARGEGSLYQRPNGLWVAAYTVSMDGGKQKRKWLYGKNQKALRKRLSAAIAKRDEGFKAQDDRITVAQFLERWLESIAKLRPRTRRFYRQQVESYLIPAFGTIRLSKLTSETIDRYFEAQRKITPAPAVGNTRAKKSPQSLAHQRAVLRTALNKARKWRMLHENPVEFSDAVSVPRSEVTAFTPANAAAVVNAVAGDRLEALYWLAIGTGMRQSELLGLRWGDITVDTATVRIAQTLDRDNGQYIASPRKVDAPRAQVALPAVVLLVLIAHRQRQADERRDAFALEQWTDWGVKAPDTFETHGLIFSNPQGQPYHGTSATHRLQKLLQAAALPRWHFRALRHASASLLAAKGVEMKVIQQRLGHTTISTTADIYTHIAPATDRLAAALLNDVLQAALIAPPESQ